MWITSSCQSDGVNSAGLPKRRRPRRRARPWATVLGLALLLAGCTSVLDRPSLPAGGTAAGTRATGVTTSLSITPVTPDGLLAGPGVTDSSIGLAVLVDEAADGGFATGVRLWQQAVNTGGGLCGRTVSLLVGGADGIPGDPASAYRQVGASVLGLLAPALPADSLLGASIAADQVPLVTATGTSTQLGPSGPLVAGATTDIATINGLQQLLTAGALARGDTVGVLDDGSGTAANALAGARWWAGRNGIDLDVRNDASSSWSADRVVLAPVDSSSVGALLTASPDAVVLTLAGGFDPSDDAAADRLYVATPAPAFGSDYPAAVAVASMAAATGVTDAGPRTLDGYAVGSSWGRLITQACTERTLTRAGIRQAVADAGAAPATSLFGASDLNLVVQSGQPATRSSSVSVADPGDSTGLRSVAGLESAPGIDDYSPP